MTIEEMKEKATQGKLKRKRYYDNVEFVLSGAHTKQLSFDEIADFAVSNYQSSDYLEDIANTLSGDVRRHLLWLSDLDARVAQKAESACLSAAGTS